MLRFASLFAFTLMWSALHPALGAGSPAHDGQGARGGRGDDDERLAKDAPLPGQTIDFEYDAADVKDKSRAYTGRVFVHERARSRTAPLVIFIHGLNRALIPHRWMGGGNEGDVRRIVSDLIDSGAIPPVILAGPGSVQKDAVAHGSSFPKFDLDKFIELVDASLGDAADIDRQHIIVTGHSGAGCSEKGGIVSATTSKQHAYAIVSIDTCMPGTLAESLGAASPDTHVVVTWQTATWDRNFEHFEQVFQKGVSAHPAHTGVFRELDNLPAQPLAHDATVKQTYAKWLPRLLSKH